MDTSSLTKEARTHNGEKTAYSISDAGKTGQLMAPYFTFSGQKELL